MEYEYAIDIERSRQDVFAFLDDEDNLKTMIPNLVDSGIIAETPEKVGTTFWHLFQEHGRKMKMTGVVTEYKPPERMAVKLDGAFFGLEVAYRLEELGPRSTRLVQESKAHFNHLFKIMGLLFRKKMEKQGLEAQKECFDRMKALLEEGSSG